VGVERNKMNQRGRLRLNLPARKIRLEQNGWQRALCVQYTLIRRVNFFFIVRHCESIDMLYLTTRVGEIILLFGQD